MEYAGLSEDCPLEPSSNGWPCTRLAMGSVYCRKTVPVLLHNPANEETDTKLLVTVSFGATRHRGQRLKALRLQLTCEEKPFFLHILDLCEDDFESLKAEQGIVIDFQRFPEKIVGLLDKCGSAVESTWPLKFQCILTTSEVQSVLRIVETNDFKQLAHISLHFRTGSDTAIKEHLAHKLRESEARLAEASSSLADCKVEKGSLQSKLAEAERSIQQQALEAAEREAVMRRDAARAAADAAHKHNTELLAAADDARREQELLQLACAKHEADARAARESSAALASRLDEATQALAAATSARHDLETELRSADARTKRAVGEAADRADVITDLRSSKRSLEDQLSAQGAIAREKAGEVERLQDNLQSAEEQRKESKQSSDTLEKRALELGSELEKSRHLIGRLTEDLRAVREKLFRKQSIIERQKEDLRGCQQSLEAAQTQVQQANSTLNDLQKHNYNQDLKEDNMQLRSKLEECTKQLQRNEQMIRWLNNQVNEAHMNTGWMKSQIQTAPRPGQEIMQTPAKDKLIAPQEQLPQIRSKFKSRMMQQLEAARGQNLVH